MMVKFRYGFGVVKVRLNIWKGGYQSKMYPNATDQGSPQCAERMILK